MHSFGHWYLLSVYCTRAGRRSTGEAFTDFPSSGTRKTDIKKKIAVSECLEAVECLQGGHKVLWGWCLLCPHSGRWHQPFCTALQGTRRAPLAVLFHYLLQLSPGVPFPWTLMCLLAFPTHDLGIKHSFLHLHLYHPMHFFLVLSWSIGVPRTPVILCWGSFPEVHWPSATMAAAYLFCPMPPTALLMSHRHMCRDASWTYLRPTVRVRGDQYSTGGLWMSSSPL